MLFEVFVSASDAVRASAVRPSVRPGYYAVELDTGTLSEAERNVLAGWASEESKTPGVVALNSSYRNRLNVPAPTSEAIIARVQMELAKIAEESQKKQRYEELKEVAIRWALAQPAESLIRKNSYANDEIKNLVSAELGEDVYALTGKSTVEIDWNDPRLAGKKAECRAEIERLQAEKAAQKAAEQAQKEAAEAAKQAEMRTWIEAHGSERLKRCLAEGIECSASYRDERLAAERPDWQWYDEVSGVYDEPRNPPVEAFAMLDDARKFDPAAKLIHIKGSDPSAYAVKAIFLGDQIVYGWPSEVEEEVEA
jgi:hypothetical protein